MDFQAARAIAFGIMVIVWAALASAVQAAIPSVVAAYSHSCAVEVGGAVSCWGDNARGQLGVSGISSSATPVRVQGLPAPVVALALGPSPTQSHSCALMESGGVYCWGSNSRAQLGTPISLGGATPASVPGLTSGVTAITANDGYTCALLTSGDTRCWGSYPSLDVAFPSGVRAIGAGLHHACVLKNDARVFCWGDNSWNQLGYSDFDVFSSRIPLEVPGLPPISAIAVGDRFTCALSSLGGVWCWGSNRLGELGDGSDPRVIMQKQRPVPVIGIGAASIQISAGSGRACAITTAGAVSCWGSNFRGELGVGTTFNWSEVPVQARGLPPGISQLSVGVGHNCAATTDGLAVCWGNSSFAQVGDGMLADRATPKIVRREGGGGAIASNDWFLDLDARVAKTVRGDLVPAFLATAQGDVNGATANVSAQVRFRPADVGNRIYVFGYAPTAAAKGATDGAPSCVLIQIPSSGQPTQVSAGSLQSYVSNVTGAGQQAVSVLNNISASAIPGTTMCVGTAATSAQAVASANSQCVATVPPSNSSTPVCVPPQDANTPSALSGLWWNAAESGWGIHFTQRSNIIFAAWYTYNASGNPKWFVSTCNMPAGTSGTSGTCNGTIFEVSGPTFFGTAFNPSLVNAVANGTLQVTFQNADAASMTYSNVSGQTRTVAIARQPLSTGTTPPAINYTDIWWGGSSESGWGMAITQQFSTMFLAWYVYDSTGKPMWYVATCTLNATACSGDLLRTTGPNFGPAFDPNQVHVFTAGTVSVNFSDGNNATLSYTVGGVTSSKTITRQLF